MEIIFLIAFSVFVLALIGFASVIRWFIRVFLNFSSDGLSTDSGPPPPSLKQDVLASRRLIEHLYIKEKIGDDRYQELCEFLAEHFPEESAASPYLMQVRQATVSKDIPLATRSDLPDQENLQIQLQPDLITQLEAIDPLAPVAPSATKSLAPSPPQATTPQQTAPWDFPDTPVPVERRTFSEMLKQFMEEKNMRWGELTSGILIVMSAIGLVVSLQDDFLGKIPYFSSLMFLLITAALIGSGLYTLKKWKLRNTSRGVLVIGLLLIPLNFLAGCILGGGGAQKDLSDPLFWMALGVGTTAFFALAWYSTQGLFRRPSLSLATTVVGSGLATIGFHRLPQISERTDSGLLTAMLLIPLGLMLLWSIRGFQSRFWRKPYWSSRFLVSSYLRYGVAIFSVVTSVSILVPQFSSPWGAFVSLTPLLLLAAISVAWLGGLIVHRRQGVGGNVSIVGKALEISGWLLAVIWWVFSVMHPTIFLINNSLIAAGLLIYLLLVARRPQMESTDFLLFPLMWGFLSLSFMYSINFWVGNLPVDDWINLSQLKTTIFSGRSGLSLVMAGLAAFFGQTLLSPHWKPALTTRQTQQTGLLCGGIIFLIGCFLAIVASFLDRANIFDNHVASALLLAGGVLAGCIVVWKNRFPATPSSADLLPADLLAADRQRNVLSTPSKWTGGVSVVLVTIGFLHAFVWNQELTSWLANYSQSVTANGVWSCLGIGLFFTGLIAWLKGSDERSMFFIVATLGLSLAMIGSAVLTLPYFPRTETGAIFMVLVTVSFIMLGTWMKPMDETQFLPRPTVGKLAILSSAVLVFVGIVQWTFPAQWLANPSIKLVLLQSIGGAGWGMVWFLLGIVLGRAGGIQWLIDRKQLMVCHVVLLWVALVFGLLIYGFSELAKIELWADHVFSASFFQDFNWIGLTLIMLSISLGLHFFLHPSWPVLVALMMLWMLGLGTYAIHFEPERASASALRWLFSGGGLILAIGLAMRRFFLLGWVMLRRQFKLTGPSVLPQPLMQNCLTLFLWATAVLVLGISLMIVFQALMVGPQSLGGPIASSWFHSYPITAYGVPLTMLVASFLVLAVSERRSDLAISGSIVMQWLTGIAILIVIFSPFVDVATKLFVRSFQAISLAMTLYAVAWYAFRNRIAAAGPDSGQLASASASASPVKSSFTFASLESHLWMNGALLSSMALLILANTYLNPHAPIGWISMFGDAGGIGAAISFIVFVLYFMKRTDGLWSISKTLCITGWLGTIVIGMAAASADWYFPSSPHFLAFRIATWGLICLSAILLAILLRGQAKVKTKRSLHTLARNKNRLQEVALETADFSPLSPPEPFARSDRDQRSPRSTFAGLAFSSDSPTENPTTAFLPLLVPLTIATLFSLQTYLLSMPAVEPLLMQVMISLILLGLAGFTWHSAFFFVAGGVLLMATGGIIARLAPASDQPWILNFGLVALVLAAVIGLLNYYYFRNRQNMLPARSYVLFPNLVLIGGSIWLTFASLTEFLAVHWSSFSYSHLQNISGASLSLSIISLLTLSLWNDRRCWFVFCFCLTTLAFVAGIVSVICLRVSPLSETVHSGFIQLLLVGMALPPLAWGLLWLNRGSWMRGLKRLHIPRLQALKRQLGWQLPAYTLSLSLITIPAAYFGLAYPPSSETTDTPTFRYLMASIPLFIAGGLACLSDARGRRWLQLGALALLTLGALFTSWAGLSWRQMQWPDTLPMMVRSMVVLALATFIYGGLVPGWVRERDHWLTSLRQMAGVTGGLAVAMLMILLANEIATFDPQIGCGLSFVESMAVAVSVMGMILGLIGIAIRPHHDPFALSMEGRKSYVYLAQLVTVGLALHLFLSMPWLFRFGILDYWPFLAVALCLAGVGLARKLAQRQLEVLADPLFVTASLFPIAISVGVFMIDSQADPSLVMLLIGLGYLFGNHARPSIFAGLAIIVYCNLSLWLFYGKFSDFDLLSYPQWWLIPPALSTLIAGQLYRDRLTSHQLSTLQYVCAAIIYLSSTGEIFIHGLGSRLLPPMILAGLSVAGILVGMMWQTRSFLYFGLIFLLMSMISMVAHAQQRLNHVWPWWAFGIILGITVMIMFGIFEKKKKEALLADRREDS